MTARVDFYHLTRDPARPVIARLAERALAQERMLVIAAGPDDRAAIDEALWTSVPHSFLPHPPADYTGTEMAGEPILILPEVPAHAPNGANIIALADGRWRDDALRFARTLYLFDGRAIDDARAAWRALARHEGVERHYWSQTERGWREGP